MAGYAVDTAELAAVESSLGDTAGEARRQLAVLAHAVEGVLSRWRGAAGGDYRDGWADWHAGALSMIDALHEMAVAVGLSGRDYAATDGSVQAAVAGTTA